MQIFPVLQYMVTITTIIVTIIFFAHFLLILPSQE